MALRGILLSMALLCATASVAQTQTQRVHYEVSLLGLTVARATFDSRINSNGFAIAGSFKSAGIARLFDQTDGTVTVSGRFAEGISRPQDYALNYLSGTKKQTTQIRFDGSRVIETMNEPPLRKRGSDWVPLREEHLQQVADPISALLLPVADAAAICNRTVRVYDGEARIDLVLSPAPASDHFRHAEVTCRAQFVPVSGYRPNHSSIIHLRDRAKIRLGFSSLNGPGLYSPIEATIGTKVGTVHVRAQPI